MGRGSCPCPSCSLLSLLCCVMVAVPRPLLHVPCMCWSVVIAGTPCDQEEVQEVSNEPVYLISAKDKLGLEEPLQV